MKSYSRLEQEYGNWKEGRKVKAQGNVSKVHVIGTGKLLSDISLYTSCLIFRDGIFYSPSDKMMISIPADHTKRQRKIQQRCIGGAAPASRRKLKTIMKDESKKGNMGFEKER